MSLSVAAVVLVLVGSTVIVHRMAASASSPYRAAESRGVRDVAAEVFGSFAGTERQRNAGLVLRAHAFNGAMDDCMDSAGFPAWDWSRSRQYATPRDPMGDGVWLAEPMRPFRSAQLIAQRPRLVQEKVLNAGEGSKAERDAALTCADNTPDASEDEANASSVSRAASKLTDTWSAMINEFLGDSAPPLESYDACMDSHSIPALEQFGLRSDDLGEAMSAVSPADHDIPQGPDDPRYQAKPWQRLLEAEHQVEVADWECRRDVYDTLMAEIEPELRRFAEQNAGEISLAQQQWSEIEIEAGRLGFHGQSGPLGA